ncbi:MAG: hypothetical protein ACKVOR_02420 [Flavobacteriales bacterium]
MKNQHKRPRTPSAQPVEKTNEDFNKKAPHKDDEDLKQTNVIIEVPNVGEKEKQVPGDVSMDKPETKETIGDKLQPQKPDTPSDGRKDGEADAEQTTHPEE